MKAAFLNQDQVLLMDGTIIIDLTFNFLFIR